MAALFVPQLLIARITHNPHVHGALANNEIKQMCSMALANLSFDEKLAKFMARDKSFPDACEVIYKLRSDESLYCINTVIFKISSLEECIALSVGDPMKYGGDSQTVTVLVDTLEKNLINCTQLAVASLCNFSLHEAFYPQITKLAMKNMVSIMASPQVAMSIKLDALHFLYNLVTVYPRSRAAAIEADCIPALAKILKAVDGNETLCVIGRIVTEISAEVTTSTPYTPTQNSCSDLLLLLLLILTIFSPTLSYLPGCSVYK